MDKDTGRVSPEILHEWDIVERVDGGWFANGDYTAIVDHTTVGKDNKAYIHLKDTKQIMPELQVTKVGVYAQEYRDKIKEKEGESRVLFEVGDKVRKKNGNTFVNGKAVCTVSYVEPCSDSDYTLIVLKETGTNIFDKDIELAYQGEEEDVEEDSENVPYFEKTTSNPLSELIEQVGSKNSIDERIDYSLYSSVDKVNRIVDDLKDEYEVVEALRGELKDIISHYQQLFNEVNHKKTKLNNAIIGLESAYLN